MATVVITGADRGLGRALVTQFADRGDRVFAGCLDPHTSFDGPTEDRITVVPLDVRSLESVKAAVSTVGATLDSLDLLLNNAGVMCDDQNQVLEDLDLEDGSLQRQFEVNTLGPLRCVQQFLPLLRAGRERRIVNISSEAGSIGQSWRVGAIGYCMSKAALNMQASILVNHLGHEGFRLVNIHPGWLVSGIGGPHAAITAETAAAGVIDWALRDWPTDRLTYIDYQGKPQLF